ncbi:MAG TPA: hypothetical protein VMV26_14300 [Alphaproteobacteria bacterium]|nr:hypothetical protein [Alphaproteobacteria bacterium]
MNKVTIVEIPITGGERHFAAGRPEAALAQFYRAFNGRDLALMACTG